MRGSSRYVDYQRVAARYQAGRALPDAVLDRWGAAVRPHLPARPLRVADVGAGTGIFAAAWPRWSATTVVAIEPAEEMIRAGDPTVGYVRGLAEELPLASGSVDVAWLSTTLHHFFDRGQAVAELGRMLRDDGRVLVRTLLPERTPRHWFEVFPGRSKALARCLGVDELVAMFGPHGFVMSHVEEVLEGTSTFADTADWIEQMQHADSMLTALTSDEIADGVRALRATPLEEVRVEISLVVFERS